MHQIKKMHLPETFIDRTKNLLESEWDAFEKALQEEVPVSIRLNPEKHSDISFEEKVPWASSAYYLPERPVFTLDPLFHAGAYYVQEASSMYLEQIINNRFSELVVALDLCAAPGGKSTHLSSLLPKDSLLIANEVISGRSGILSENIIKWGNPYSIVTNNDPKEIGSLLHRFDMILTDVPCSGEGMFRKDPAAINEWSVNNVHLCAERQRRIVADIWPALKPGGILIYSTCTYNREENEDNITWICQELGAKIVEEPRRFFPHRNKGEGFFIAALQKEEKDQQNNRATQRKEKKRATSKQRNPIPIHFNYVMQWLKDPETFDIFEDSSLLKAFPKNYSEVYNQIKSCLRVISSGIVLGEIKGKDLIPSHSLSMSTALSKNAFPRWEIDKETALHYLHKDSFQSLPDNLPKGYVLLTHQSLPLGFIKNIGSRANNLYPSEWRIRMNIQ